MLKKKVVVLDLIAPAPSKPFGFRRFMMANMAGLMPQVVAVWAEELGHDVTYIPYTGTQDLRKLLSGDIDVLIISAFTQSALLATAVSNWARNAGIVTVLGGPHARSYADDATRWFDWVLGFTDKDTLRMVLEGGPRRPIGQRIAAAEQPKTLPTLRQRWHFQQQLLGSRGSGITVIPHISSLGCPYTCPFCVDAPVKYQPLDFEPLKADLQFLKHAAPGAVVSFYDPNFAVRFDATMTALEEVNHEDGPPVRFIAESSLAILRKERLERMEKAGCVALLPGIESWGGFGGKAGHARTGMEKVRETATHLNQVLDHIPYLQTNFVLGLDIDEGDEPFELTKRFVDLCPGAFPGYSLLTAFGDSAPANAEYHEQGRIIPIPYHFLNNNLGMNVRPLNYSWPDFYDRLISLVEYTFGKRQVARRAANTKYATTKWINLLRAVTDEGRGRLAYHRSVRQALDEDIGFRAFLEGDSVAIPERYIQRIQKDLGALYESLPKNALVPGEQTVTAAA